MEARHIGPTAQDFQNTFDVGNDDKSIATIDADGAALAAIQGLNEKLEQQLEQKETEIAELRQRLKSLENCWAASSKEETNHETTDWKSYIRSPKSEPNPKPEGRRRERSTGAQFGSEFVLVSAFFGLRTFPEEERLGVWDGND